MSARERAAAVARMWDRHAPDPVDAAGRMTWLLEDDGLSYQQRAGAALFIATGAYPDEAQCTRVTRLLTAGRGEIAQRLLERIATSTPASVVNRSVVTSTDLVVDLTRSGLSGEVSGIPRVARALAAAARERSSQVVAWRSGAPTVLSNGPVRVESTPSVTSSVLSRVRGRYSATHRRLNEHPRGAQISSAVQWAVRPAKRRLDGRADAEPAMLLDHVTYVTVEVPTPDVVSRLLAWRAIAPGMRLRTVVHDVLPLLFPDDFPEAAVIRHTHFARLIAGSDSVVVASDRVAEQVVHVAGAWRAGPPPPLRVVPYGTSADEWVPVPPEPDDRPSFVAVGGLEVRKNYDILLLALMALARDGRPSTLHVVGNRRPIDPDLRRLLAAAEESGVRVRRHIGARDEQVAGLLDACVASVYLSEREGYGLPPLESLARGVPVVVTDVPPVNAHHAIGGVVAVRPNRPDEVARVLRWLLDDPEYGRSLRAAIRGPIPRVEDWTAAVLDAGSNDAQTRLC